MTDHLADRAARHTLAVMLGLAAWAIVLCVGWIAWQIVGGWV